MSDRSRAFDGAVGCLMQLRELLSEFEERIDGKDIDGANDSAEKVVLEAAEMLGYTRRLS